MLIKKLLILILLLLSYTTLNNTKPFGLINSNDLYWLSLNIYKEARNQPYLGKLAVGLVTINRRDHQYLFANSIEGVVKEPFQFSWYNSKINISSPLTDLKAWYESQEIAIKLLTNEQNSDIIDLLDGATYYHTKKVKPRWSKSLVKTVQISDHIFYKIKDPAL